MINIFKLIRIFIITFYEEFIKEAIIKKFIASVYLEAKKIKYIYFVDGGTFFHSFVEFIKYNIKKRYIRLKVVLFRDQTTSVRFFFGLMCIGFSSFFLFSSSMSLDHSEYRIMIEKLPRWVWALSYFIIGISLVYGVIEEKFNFFLLITEGMLSVLTWCISAYYVYQAQSIPGAHAIGAIMSLWLYIRYPTHKMKSDSYYRRKITKYKVSPDKPDIDISSPSKKDKDGI